ncbi:MAG: response regulator transcription factor [Desulfuromonadaceae bacterium]|nr:response regulator transcription factor [Desulfuromonas sp.]MDY0184954.1 response regulator transcription factor [Desulfuromonadaceae bacterium]
MHKILIIDDDKELCELLHDYLGAEGLDIVSVHQGDIGVQAALTQKVDLVILDVMLPEMNGFDVLRAIRKESQVPIIMLTARGEEIDRIVGLELGADDYLPKPFNPRELMARIRAIQRRLITQRDAVQSGDTSGSETLEVGDIRLFPGSRTVQRAEQNLELTSAEFDLLAMLLRHAGEVVSRQELVEEVLGRRNSPYDRSVDVHISALRRKLKQHPDEAQKKRDQQGGKVQERERIVTVRNAGYMYATGAKL